MDRRKQHFGSPFNQNGFNLKRSSQCIRGNSKSYEQKNPEKRFSQMKGHPIYGTDAQSFQQQQVWNSILTLTFNLESTISRFSNSYSNSRFFNLNFKSPETSNDRRQQIITICQHELAGYPDQRPPSADSHHQDVRIRCIL